MKQEDKNQLELMRQQALVRTGQVKNLAARLSEAEQAERDRLARMLHDDLQQILHSIQLHMHIISESGDFSKDAFKSINAELKEAIEMTRDLSTEMSPPVLKEKGLIEGLGWLKQRFMERHFFEVSLRVEGAMPEMEKGIEFLLFHLTRELLFNAVKHAGTAKAEVIIRLLDGRLILEVNDEGKGFDQAIVNESDSVQSGFGLRGARERVELFGGDIKIISNPGDGTSIVLSVPIGMAETHGSLEGAGRK